MQKNLLLSEMSRQGHTQRSFSRMIGMSKNTFNAKINGKRPFDTDEVERICQALSITDNTLKAQIFLT